MANGYIKVENEYYYEFEDIIYVFNFYVNGIHVPVKEKPAIKKDLKENVKSITVSRRRYWSETDICDYMSDKLPDVDFNLGFKSFHLRDDIENNVTSEDMLKLHVKLLRQEAELLEVIAATKNHDAPDDWEQYQKTKVLIKDAIPRYLPHEFNSKNLGSFRKVYHDDGFHGQKATLYLANMLGVYDDEYKEKPDEKTAKNAIKKATKK